MFYYSIIILLTDIIILLALAVVPHRDGEALLGQVHNVGHEDKLDMELSPDSPQCLAHLFIELGADGAPLNRGLLPALWPALRHHHPDTKTYIQKYINKLEQSFLTNIIVIWLIGS